MYADGNGLYLQVDPSGARRWVQRIVVNGRRRKFGLGGWPEVSLAEARRQAVLNLGTVRAGGDPLVEKRRRSMPIFAEAAGRVIAFRRPTWKSAKHAAHWESTLSTYAYLVIGSRPVSEITGSDVLRVLTPIWTSNAETARRVRQRIGAVLDWAVAQGYRSDNPAGAISAALPRQRRTARHHAALHYSEVAAAVRRVWDSDAMPVTKLAFEFLVLTATRSGDVRLAVWDEVDWDTRSWSIPGERMKANRDHRIPLAERALEVLAQARELGDGQGWVFPRGRSGRPLSDMTHRNLMNDLVLVAPDGRPAVPHGSRSSFKDWASETGVPEVVSELALAHVRKNQTEAATPGQTSSTAAGCSWISGRNIWGDAR